MILRILIVVGVIFIPYLIGKLSGVEDNPIGRWQFGFIICIIIAMILAVSAGIAMWVFYGKINI